MHERKTLLYEGKAKILFPGPDCDSLIQHFKDDITAYNAQQKDVLTGKGIINNRISYLLMRHLESKGVKTHLLKLLNDREQLVKKVSMISIEVVVRNFAAGSFCKKFGIRPGEPISPSVIEFYYKDDVLSDPMITEDHIVSFGLATVNEIEHIKAESLKINKVLNEVFTEADILLVDFKLEFGRAGPTMTEIILADEISPDTCRLWDTLNNNQVLDKDRYRLRSGDVLQGYSEVLCRLEKRLRNVKTEL